MNSVRSNTIQGGRSMKVTIESTGDFNDTVKWLEESSRTIPSNTIRDIGQKGVESLSANTPVGETGETARGWYSEVEIKGNVAEVSFMNNAHPEAQVNMAKLIELGHGTGTGGYVPPQPYIKQSMDAVWNDAADKIAKEMMK